MVVDLIYYYHKQESLINHFSLNTNDNVLILNKLVKEDGTIDVIEDNSLTKSEIKEILDNKLEELFDQHFEKWLNSKLPAHLEKYFNKK